MFNSPTKYLIVLTGLSPVLFICWIVNLVQQWPTLGLYFAFRLIISGIVELLNIHWLLLAFLISVWFSRYLLSRSIEKIPPVKMDVKTIKPAEINFTPLILTALAGWLKYYFTDVKDIIFLIGTVFIYILYAFIFRDSYHYNLIYKVCFGYRFYEIQESNVTYLLISREKIYNPAEVTQGIILTDYMVINSSLKPR